MDRLRTPGVNNNLIRVSPGLGTRHFRNRLVLGALLIRWKVEKIQKFLAIHKWPNFSFFCNLNKVPPMHIATFQIPLLGLKTEGIVTTPLADGQGAL